jgi:tetratricopeptide (TPR) repeat protein
MQYPHLYNAVDTLSAIIHAKTAIIRDNASDFDAWRSLLFSYLLLTDYPNAYSAATHLIRLTKKLKDIYVCYCTGIIYNYFHYQEDALRYLYTARTKFTAAKQFPDLYLRIALIQRQSGNHHDADAILRTLLNPPPPGLTKDDIKFQIAYTMQRMGKSHEAYQGYDSLLTDHPTCQLLKQQFIWFLSLQNDPRNLARARLMCSESPSDSLTQFAAARIAMKQNDMAEAFRGYCECTSAWVDSPLFWGGLGSLYLRNDQTDDAIVAFQRALTHKPDLPEIWLNLGLTVELKGDAETALRIYETGMAHCKAQTELRNRIAMINGAGRRGQVGGVQLKDIIDLDANDAFVQPAEKLSRELLETPPDLAGAKFLSEAQLEALKPAVLRPFKSMFG